MPEPRSPASIYRFGPFSGPGDECAVDRAKSRDDLAAGRAEVIRHLDPQGDGCAVADGADVKCGCQLARADSPSARDGKDQAARRWDARRRCPSPGSPARRDLIDPGRHALSMPSTHMHRRSAVRRVHPDAWLEHQGTPAIVKCCREQPATEVLAEHGGRQSDGGGQLEVQHQRCGGGRHLGEVLRPATPGRAPPNDGETERTPPAATPRDGLVGGRTAVRRRAHAENRPGQDERRHVAGEHRRGGSRRTEEHGCGETSEHPTGGHVLRLPCEPAPSSPDAGRGCVLASTR